MKSAAIILGALVGLLAAAGQGWAQVGIINPNQTSQSAQRSQPTQRQLLDEAKRKADEAKKADEAAEKKDEAARLKKAEEELRKARLGKATVLKIGTLRSGAHELVSVTIERDGGERVLVVAQVQDRQKRWVTDDDLVAALREIPSGTYEVIHAEEKYGLEWVTGVGESSPKTLDELARLRSQKKGETASGEAGSATSATSGGGKDKPKVEPLAGGAAVGRFVKVGEETVGGKALKTVVIERGVQMDLTTYYLATVTPKGLTAAKKDLVQAAEKLAAGAVVRLDYVEAEGKYFVTGIKQTE